MKGRERSHPSTGFLHQNLQQKPGGRKSVWVSHIHGRDPSPLPPAMQISRKLEGVAPGLKSGPSDPGFRFPATPKWCFNHCAKWLALVRIFVRCFFCIHSKVTVEASSLLIWKIMLVGFWMLDHPCIPRWHWVWSCWDSGTNHWVVAQLPHICPDSRSGIPKPTLTSDAFASRGGILRLPQVSSSVGTPHQLREVVLWRSLSPFLNKR